MARRPVRPASNGWKRDRVPPGRRPRPRVGRRARQDADVVVHLAFIVVRPAETRDINLEGSRNVFQAAVDAGVKRLVYASSVAAYGFTTTTRGCSPRTSRPAAPTRSPTGRRRPSSRTVLDRGAERRGDRRLRVPALHRRRARRADADRRDPVRAARRAAARPGARLFDQVPILKPVLPDPGVPFQLVHHDDVATALRAAVLGRGKPGVYNLAGRRRADGRATSPTRWARYAMPVPSSPSTRPRRSSPPAVPAGRGDVGRGGPHAGADGHGQGARELRWSPSHDAQETLRADRRGAREDLRRDSVTGTPKRCCASPIRPLRGSAGVAVAQEDEDAVGREGRQRVLEGEQRLGLAGRRARRRAALARARGGAARRLARRRRSPRRQSEIQKRTGDWLIAGETTRTSAPSRSSPGSALRTAAASTGSGARTRSFMPVALPPAAGREPLRRPGGPRGRPPRAAGGSAGERGFTSGTSRRTSGPARARGCRPRASATATLRLPEPEAVRGVGVELRARPRGGAWCRRGRSGAARRFAGRAHRHHRVRVAQAGAGTSCPRA